MKTKHFAIITTVILINFFSLSAQAVNTSISKNIDEAVESSVKYPKEAKDAGITGFVLVEVGVNKEGSVKVKQVNSDNDLLKNYVINQLNNIKVSDAGNTTDELANEIRFYKFIFELL